MFTPTNGKSKREVVYEAIRDTPTGELIPYAQLPYDLETVRALRDTVSKLFEREQQRHVECVRTEGWRIVRGIEQVEAAARKRRQATRRMGRSLQIIEATDRREMSGEQRLRADQELVQAGTAYGLLRGLALKRPGLQDVERWQAEHPNGA